MSTHSTAALVHEQEIRFHDAWARSADLASVTVREASGA